MVINIIRNQEMEGVRMNRITLADPVEEIKAFGRIPSNDEVHPDESFHIKVIKNKFLSWEKNHSIDCYDLIDMDTGELINSSHFGLVFTKDESNALVRLMSVLRLDNKKFLAQINGMIKDVDGMVDEIDEVQKELRDADKKIRKAIEAEREEHNLRVKAYEKEVSGLKWLLKRINSHPLVKLIRRLPWVRL